MDPNTTEVSISFVKADIADADAVTRAMEGCDAVVSFAAETHVDRSIQGASEFIDTDVRGVHNLVEAAKTLGTNRVLLVSTDEVYGSILEGSFKESDPMGARNPYSASKAGGDLLCHAYVETYGLPVIVARPANNVGPRQYPEKAVPLFVTNALDDEPLPLYGDGLQIRDRLFVDDNCEALDLLLHEGEPGEAYNIGADNERTNIEVAEAILEMLEKPRSLIRFVEDRPGHDQRYALVSDKIRALGWSPRHDFDSALEKTVSWYRDNRSWWEKIKSGEYREYYERMYAKRLAEARPQQP